MTNQNIEQKINELKQDYITYRNKCVFKIQEEKNQDYPVSKRCLRCNGISSVLECDNFIDIPHLIHFYKTNSLNKYDKEVITNETII